MENLSVVPGPESEAHESGIVEDVEKRGERFNGTVAERERRGAPLSGGKDGQNLQRLIVTDLKGGGERVNKPCDTLNHCSRESSRHVTSGDAGVGANNHKPRLTSGKRKSDAFD